MSLINLTDKHLPVACNLAIKILKNNSDKDTVAWTKNFVKSFIDKDSSDTYDFSKYVSFK